MIEETPSGWECRRLDRKVGVLLRTGMLASAAVTVFGGTFFLRRHGRDLADYHTFQPVPASLRSVHDILAGAVSGHALAIVQAGLLMLIATPIARVIFLVFGFAVERDYLYTALAALVLGVLLYGLLIH